MNTITVAGRLTRDAETKQVGKDQVVQFAIAEDVFANKEKSAQFFDVSFWGERGAKVAKYLRKGGHVTVSGSLTTREHNGKMYMQIRCNDVALQGGGKSASTFDDSQERVDSADPVKDGRGGDAENFSGSDGDDLPF